MKKSFSNAGLLLLAAASGWFTMMRMLYVWGAAKEAYGVGLEVFLFIVALFATLALFLVAVFLGMKGKTHPMVGVAFLPIALMAGILTFWFVIFRPWVREFTFRLDGNPLYNEGCCESFMGGAHVTIFQPEFWMTAEDAKARLAPLYNQRVKNDRLIKFSDPKSLHEILGIEEGIVLEAFGQPFNRSVADSYEVWVYHPWENHPDWEMKVFLKDGRLAGIGGLE